MRADLCLTSVYIVVLVWVGAKSETNTTHTTYHTIPVPVALYQTTGTYNITTSTVALAYSTCACVYCTALQHRHDANFLAGELLWKIVIIASTKAITIATHRHFPHVFPYTSSYPPPTSHTHKLPTPATTHYNAKILDTSNPHFFDR